MSLFAKVSEEVAPTSASVGVDERRVHFRLNASGIVEIGFFPDKRKYDATLYDLSMGGCGLKIEPNSMAQVNAIVELKMRVRGLSLRIDGIIRNVMGNSDRVGIEFMDVKPDQAVRIYQLMGELYDKGQGKMSLI